MKLAKGLSFSLKRAIGITGVKQSIAKKLVFRLREEALIEKLVMK